MLLQVTKAEAKDILFDNASRRKMQDGIEKIANAVAVTLGPRGKRSLNSRALRLGGVPRPQHLLPLFASRLP
jgi:hypothetical protein